jgi:2-polyprenyl-6-methoxyphenol hydroxylase-like FAD-dependent oxidoreductase
MVDADVLIAGAGPIGLTTAIELGGRGVHFRIVDPITDPPQYAKTVGVQPRTLEVLEGLGVLDRILDAAIQMFGQMVYVNGEKAAQRVDHGEARPAVASPQAGSGWREVSRDEHRHLQVVDRLEP